MKTGISIFLFSLSSLLFGQVSDSAIYDSEIFEIYKNLNTNTYSLTIWKNKTKYKNLKFAKRIYRSFQILDADNNIFYVRHDGEVLDDMIDFIGVCGTVPHYTLFVNKTDDYFEILEDETFYDHNNKESAVVKMNIPREEADSVLFINGRDRFDFTSNFDVGIENIDPRTIILVKDGKYFTPENPELKFDSIDFSSYYTMLKTQKDSLYGMLGVIEPRYKSIEPFTYHLAEAVLPDGTKVFIDIEGNQY